MDRLKREGNPPVGQLASPVPQYKGAADWETLEGEGGASFVKDRDAIAKLEQVRALLSGVATEDKLEQARTLLQSLAGKDFATQATLAQVKSELELVKAELVTIKANQLSGDQKVQLSGNMVTRLARQQDLMMSVGNTVNILEHTSRDEFKSISINLRRYPSDREYEIRHLFGGALDGSNDFTEIIPVEFQGNQFSIIIPVRDIRWGIGIRHVSGSDGLLNRIVIGGIR